MAAQLVCDFCDLKLVDNEIVVKDEMCCENMDLFKDNGMNIFKSCGAVNGYDLRAPYIDYNENMYVI